MTTTEAALVSGAVVALTQLLKWTKIIPEKFGPLSVLVWSLCGVLIWAYSAEAFRRANTFELFSGWITVSLAAAGIYGFTRAGAETLARATPPPSGAGAEPVAVRTDDVDAITDQLVSRITDRLLERSGVERRRMRRQADPPSELDEPAFLRRGGA